MEVCSWLLPVRNASHEASTGTFTLIQAHLSEQASATCGSRRSHRCGAAMNVSGFPGALVTLFLLSDYGWGRLCGLLCDVRILKFILLLFVLGLAQL